MGKKSIFVLAALACSLVFVWLEREQVQVISEQNYSSDDLSKVENPLRGAPSLVQREAATSVDLRELEQPYSRDSEGTEIAGMLRVNEDGLLVVDSELKDFFDYFLSSVGEVTPEQALRRIHLHLMNELPKAQAEYAMEILAGYLAFKEASIDLLAQPIDQALVQNDAQYRLQQLDYALNQLKTLRREYLAEDLVQAMFYQDEAYADYTLRTQYIAMDDQLSDEEKWQQRRLARDQLPDDMREILTQQEERAKALQGWQNLLISGASVTQLEQYAQDAFSPEEAQALMADIQQQQNLKSQYDRYREEVAGLEQQGLSASDFNQAMQDLRSSYFNEDEASMVLAWDLAQSQ